MIGIRATLLVSCMSPLCFTVGCERNAVAKGLCQRCYQRQYWRQKREMQRSPAEQERRNQQMLAMMDPKWNIPPWRITKGKPWAAEQISAKKRIQALYRSTGMKKASLARLCGVNYVSVLDWLRDASYFPSIDNARKVHAAIDAYEREHPAPQASTTV